MTRALFPAEMDPVPEHEEAGSCTSKELFSGIGTGAEGRDHDGK